MPSFYLWSSGWAFCFCSPEEHSRPWAPLLHFMGMLAESLSLVLADVGTCRWACSLGKGCELVSRFPTTLDAGSKRSPSLTLHVVLDSSLHFKTRFQQHDGAEPRPGLPGCLENKESHAAPLSCPTPQCRWSLQQQDQRCGVCSLRVRAVWRKGPCQGKSQKGGCIWARKIEAGFFQVVREGRGFRAGSAGRGVAAAGVRAGGQPGNLV